MFQLTRSRLLVGAAACTLLLAGCSGGSSDLSAPTEAAEAAPDAGSAAPANGEPSASTELDPHCWDNDSAQPTCPRQLTPTTWVDLHSFGSRTDFYPIEGTKVATAQDASGVDSLQVWDVADPDWGRAVKIDPPGDYSLQGRRTYLGGGLMAYRYGSPDDTENTGIAVYDLFADEPTTPVFEKKLAGPGRFTARLGSDRFGVEIRGTDTSELQVWALGAQTPTHTVVVDRVSFLAGDGADTLYYVTDRPSEMWQWKPPAAPELIGPSPGFDDGATILQVGTSGRVLLAHGEFIDVFEPSTGQTLTLTGVDAGFDNRYQAIAISELPDGRIVGHYPAGETAYWDVEQPDNPTITLAEDHREWTGASALENGQVLQGWLIGGPEGADYDITAAIELVTPPAP